MVVYDNVQAIPWETLRNGGRFQVWNVPAEMSQVGLGMGAHIDAGKYLLAVDGNGNEVLIPEILITLAPFIWFTIQAIIVVVVVVSITTAVGGLIYSVRSVPEGEVKSILEDGTRVWQSSDGSTWLLHPDGSFDQIGGSTFEKLTTVLIVVVVVIVSVALVWRFVIKKPPKPPPKKEPEKEPEKKEEKSKV